MCHFTLKSDNENWIGWFCVEGLARGVATLGFYIGCKISMKNITTKFKRTPLNFLQVADDSDTANAMILIWDQIHSRIFP